MFFSQVSPTGVGSSREGYPKQVEHDVSSTVATHEKTSKCKVNAVWRDHKRSMLCVRSSDQPLCRKGEGGAHESPRTLARSSGSVASTEFAIGRVSFRFVSMEDEDEEEEVEGEED